MTDDTTSEPRGLTRYYAEFHPNDPSGIQIVGYGDANPWDDVDWSEGHVVCLASEADAALAERDAELDELRERSRAHLVDVRALHANAREMDAEIERLRNRIQVVASQRDRRKMARRRTLRGMAELRKQHAREYVLWNEDILAYERDSDRKDAQIAELRAAMREVEWEDASCLPDGTPIAACHWCDGTTVNGHAPDCTFTRLVPDPEQPQGGEGE